MPGSRHKGMEHQAAGRVDPKKHRKEAEEEGGWEVSVNWENERIEFYLWLHLRFLGGQTWNSP